MSDKALQARLVEKVEGYGYVTFGELTNRFFPEHVGDRSLELSDYKNLVLWTGLSDELVEAVSSAIAEGQLHLWPATDMTYLLDGFHLNLPEAKRVQPYKEPHWIKMCLHHKPYSEAAA